MGHRVVKPLNFRLLLGQRRLHLVARRDVADVALDDPLHSHTIDIADTFDGDVPAIAGDERQVLVADIPLPLQGGEGRLGRLPVVEDPNLPECLPEQLLGPTP